MSTINSQAIIESINRIQANSLLHQTYAWVAVTGKPELFVRDHLGADLSAHNPDVIVSREWNKHDLVILDLLLVINHVTQCDHAEPLLDFLKHLD